MEQTLKDIEYLITEGWLLPAFTTPRGRENEILDTIRWVLDKRDNPTKCDGDCEHCENGGF